MWKVFDILEHLCITFTCLKLLEYTTSASFAESFTEIVGFFFWWLPVHLDTFFELEMVLGTSGINYHFKIQALAIAFVDDVNVLCQKYKNSLAKVIDNPSIDRLRELVTHALPVFHHPSFVGEMVFKAFHQPLKSALSRKFTKKVDISAMCSLLSNDWLLKSISHLDAVQS